MQLNEIIENNGIAAISKRTRISAINVERLANRDFTNMQRVKAQGFISILEREYDADLDMLRQECRDFFASHTEEIFDVTRVVTTPMSIDAEDKPVSKAILIVILALLGYASWYFFVDKDKQSDNNITQSQGFISKMIDQAGDMFSSSDSIDDINDTTLQSDEVWAKLDTKTNTTVSSTSEEADTKEAESNESMLEAKIIRDAKEEQKDIIVNTAEQKPAKTIEIVDYTGGDGMLASEVPSMVSVNNADEAVAIEEEADNTPAQEPVVEEKPKPKAKPKSSKVVFHPLKKVWIGYTNLKTMKRATEVTQSDISFDTSKGDWILVAAHRGMSFISGNKEIKTKKIAGNYFSIKKGKVKAITKEEFQKLNKSTAW